MDIFRNLAAAISKRKLRYVHPIYARNDQVDRLLRLIEENEDLSDQEAMDRIFPRKSHHNNIYLTRLKKILLDRLLSTILMLNPDEDLPAEKQARWRIQKEFSAIEVMKVNGKLRDVAPVAERVIKKAIRYNFADIVVQLATTLRQYHGLITKNEQDYNYYTSLFHKFQDLQRSERHVSSLYLDLTFQINKTKSPSEEAVEMAQVYAKQARSVLKAKHFSTKLIVLSYNLIYLNAQIQGEIEQMVSTCIDAAKALGGLPFKQDTSQFSFLYKAIHISLQTNKLDDLSKLIEECAAYAKPGSRNSFMLSRLKMIYLFRTEQFNEVRKELLAMNRRGLAEQERQELVLLEGFYHFFAGLQLCRPVKNSPSALTSFKSDKPGKNTTAKIITFLHGLAAGEHDLLIENAEALELYAYRYLNKAEYENEFNFIKALVTIPNNSFRKDWVMEAAEKYLAKIDENLIQAEINIIPYSRLWQYAMRCL